MMIIKINHKIKQMFTIQWGEHCFADVKLIQVRIHDELKYALEILNSNHKALDTVSRNIEPVVFDQFGQPEYNHGLPGLVLV